MGFSKQLLNHPELVKTVNSNTMPRPSGLARLTAAERAHADAVSIERRLRFRGDTPAYEIQLSSLHSPYGQPDYIRLPCCLGDADEPLAEAVLAILVRYHDVDMRSLGLTALRTVTPPIAQRRRYLVWPTFWPDYDAVVQQARGLLAMEAFTPAQPPPQVSVNGDIAYGFDADGEFTIPFAT